jgi:hypothetical protein
MEELAVGAGTDFVDDGGLEINEHAARHVLSSAGLRKECVESVVTSTDSLIGRHLAIGLDTVLKAIKLPASVTGLDTSLSNVD